MDAMKILGGLLGNNAAGGNLLGSILKGGGSQSREPAGGGLGALGSLLGGGGTSRGGSSGGSNLLGMIMKAALAKQMMGGGASSASGGIGGLLGSVFGGGAQPQPEEEEQFRQIPQQQVQDQATLMVRAMCNAAKADGQIDAQEQQNIIGRMGELDQAEVDFLKHEFSSPLDLQGFVSSVPRDMGPQVYALSVMTVKVDTRQEATYLQQLAQGLDLDRQTVSSIHEQMGLA